MLWEVAEKATEAAEDKAMAVAEDKATVVVEDATMAAGYFMSFLFCCQTQS
jgi:hypothetical protein